jgi:putative glycosyltransferase (TIGR04372 family)
MMTPVPPHGNFIDYGNSAIRADWMDIFILARCRFLIGTNSGPAFIPSLYGTPSLLTNWWPAAERPWHQSDVFIPKILRHISSDRGLTLSETLQEPMASCYSRQHLAAHAGVRLEDNDPGVISAAVREMLDRLDGAEPDVQTMALRTRADSIYEANGIAGAAQLACEFLRRHGDLIA